MVLGTPKANFPSIYQDSFKQALKTFFDEEWPCEAKHPKLQERCVIVRTRHNTTKGHQLASGKSWSGEYETRRDIDVEPYFTEKVFRLFNKLVNTLMTRAKEKDLLGSAAEKRIAFEIHQHDIMRQRCNFLRGHTNFVSHRICLCCLYQVPVHPLLCGHVICDLCLRASGKEARENVVRLRECPICGTIWSQGRVNVEIVRKPDGCGIRVLTLDG